MKTIEKAIAHLKAFEPRVLEIPEWGDEAGPLCIHVTPLTMRERDILSKYQENPRELMIEAVILKAKDTNGESLFSKEDKPLMKTNVDAAILERIGLFILAAPTQDEAEKN